MWLFGNKRAKKRCLFSAQCFCLPGLSLILNLILYFLLLHKLLSTYRLTREKGPKYQIFQKLFLAFFISKFLSNFLNFDFWRHNRRLGRNFNFWRNIWLFGRNFNFWQNIWTFGRNSIFGEIFGSLAEISILAK